MIGADSTSPRGGSQDAVTERASAYIERRRFEAWSGADQAELDAWLAESVSHRIAYLRLETAATQAKELFALRRSGRVPGPAANGTSGMPWRFAVPLLAAASIAMFAMLGMPLVKSLMQPPDRVDSTDVGGRTLLSFADHTQIELNTDTSVRLRMTTAERTVWLEKGEAWFHVTHDAAHPFTVIIGKDRITDLGTEFLVRRHADNVDVTLLNGRATLSTGGIQAATLVPGEEAIATPTSLSVTRKTGQELADELAWRRGLLVFRNTRLADVVKEFNRYNRTKLVIADPAIAGDKINGNAKADDYEGFLQLVEAALNLRVERAGNEILILNGQRARTRIGAHAGRSL